MHAQPPANVQDARRKLAQMFAQVSGAVGLQVGRNYFAAINCSNRGWPRDGANVGPIFAQPGER